jgi:hypothetical protein
LDWPHLFNNKSQNHLIGICQNIDTNVIDINIPSPPSIMIGKDGGEGGEALLTWAK